MGLQHMWFTVDQNALHSIQMHLTVYTTVEESLCLKCQQSGLQVLHEGCTFTQAYIRNE